MRIAAQPDPTFLRNALRANATFSGLSGALLIAAGEPLGRFLGVTSIYLVGTGVNLLAFAAALAHFAGRPTLSRPIALAIVAADLGWIVAAGLLIPFGVFTPHGAIAALAVSGVVLCFAALQWVGLRRLGAAPLAPGSRS